VLGFAMLQEENSNKSNFCSVTFRFRQPNDILAASSEFKVLSTTKSG